MNRNGCGFDLGFCELFQFFEYRSKRVLIFRVIIGTSSHTSDVGKGFLIEVCSDRLPCLIEEILFLAQSIGDIEVGSSGISDTERVDLDSLFLCELGRNSRIDTHIGSTIGQDDDDFLPVFVFRVFFISFEGIERDQETISHSSPREPWDILADGVRRHMFDRIYESGIIKGQRSREKRFPCEENDRETIAREMADEIAHDAFRCLNTIGFYILGEHGFGDIEDDGDIDTFLGNFGTERA